MSYRLLGTTGNLLSFTITHTRTTNSGCITGVGSTSLYIPGQLQASPRPKVWVPWPRLISGCFSPLAGRYSPGAGKLVGGHLCDFHFPPLYLLFKNSL